MLMPGPDAGGPPPAANANADERAVIVLGNMPVGQLLHHKVDADGGPLIQNGSEEQQRAHRFA